MTQKTTEEGTVYLPDNILIDATSDFPVNLQFRVPEFTPEPACDINGSDVQVILEANFEWLTFTDLLIIVSFNSLSVIPADLNEQKACLWAAVR